MSSRFVRLLTAIAAVGALLASGSPASAGTVQPDAILLKVDQSDVLGNNVYNSTGASQTKTRSVPAGSTFVYLFRMQNDSSEVQFLTPSGCASNASFKVKYFLPQSPNPDIDITQSITDGALSVGRNPGQNETYRVVIKVKGTAPAGATLTCRLKVKINVKGPGDPVDVARIVIHRA